MARNQAKKLIAMRCPVKLFNLILTKCYDFKAHSSYTAISLCQQTNLCKTPARLNWSLNNLPYQNMLIVRLRAASVIQAMLLRKHVFISVEGLVVTVYIAIFFLKV